MVRTPTAAIAAASLIGGYAVAAGSGSRPLGGLVLVAGGLCCARIWTHRDGPGTAAALTGLGLGAFVARACPRAADRRLARGAERLRGHGGRRLGLLGRARPSARLGREARVQLGQQRCQVRVLLGAVPGQRAGQRAGSRRARTLRVLSSALAELRQR